MTTPTPTININHRIATYEGPPLVGENEKYKLAFTFDEEWEGTIKIARFVWNRKFYDVPLDQNNQCEIPSFPSNAKLTVGVYNHLGYTSSAAEIPISNSIKDGAIVPQPMRPVEWQLVERINLTEEAEIEYNTQEWDDENGVHWGSAYVRHEYLPEKISAPGAYAFVVKAPYEYAIYPDYPDRYVLYGYFYIDVSIGDPHDPDSWAFYSKGSSFHSYRQTELSRYMALDPYDEFESIMTEICFQILPDENGDVTFTEPIWFEVYKIEIPDLEGAEDI